MQDTRDSYLKGIASRDVRGTETWREGSHVVARSVLHYAGGNALLVHVQDHQILTAFCVLPGHNPFDIAAEAISAAYPKATRSANHYIA